MGGLETHIEGQVRQLKNLNYRVVVATGSAGDLVDALNIDKSYAGINFNFVSDRNNLQIATSTLKKIILDESVDIVHAHPFLSIPAAYLACNETGAKFLYTLHGPSSVENDYGDFNEKLMGAIINTARPIVVSDELNKIVRKKYPLSNPTTVPNTVLFPEVSIENSRAAAGATERWAVISRIDAYKAAGIRKLIEFLIIRNKHSPLTLSVIGDGPDLENLREWVDAKDARFIDFRGFIDNDKIYNENYSVICGMGRVVLEAISARKPICLVGYDGIKGIINTPNRLVIASKSNFSGRNMENIHYPAFEKEITKGKFNLSEKVYHYARENYYEKNVWRRVMADKKLLNTVHDQDIYNILEKQLSVEGFKLYNKGKDRIGWATLIAGGELMRAGSKRILRVLINPLKSEKIKNDSQAEATTGIILRKYIADKEIPEDQINYEKAMIKESGYFDEGFYLKQNDDVRKSGMDPLDHYVRYGGFEGRSPSALFDAKYYLETYADVREAYVSPLLHYISIGKSQERRIKPLIRRSKVVATKNVDIVNVNFYDWEGKVLYKGGAERYVFDLACLLKNMGYTPRILQNATRSFKKNYRGIEVLGVKTGATTIRDMSKSFAKQCKDAALVIASPLDLACEIRNVRTIGINHGIHWDTTQNALYRHRTDDYNDIFNALQNIATGVCVDTNFINWTRTYDYGYATKLRYIPNYYDKNDFTGRKKSFDNELIFTYPRRLYDARGIYLTLDAFRKVLKTNKNIKLKLVGQTTDKKVIKAVNELIAENPNSVSLTEYDMEDMHKAYEDSHVVLIPTRYSEGTSLSCIEGMATNNALITTDVGGLPNLVIGNFNGHIIEPTVDALVRSIKYFDKNRGAVAEMAKNGLKLVEVFNKDNWEKSWKNILKEALR